MRVCILDDCSSVHKGGGYCNKHWQRFKKTGSTNEPIIKLKYGIQVKGTPEYRCWKRIRSVTTNPNNPKWSIYGGRGIKMCDRWGQSFNDFYKDMGPRPDPTFSIERVDVNGNYEPSNCVWADDTIQARNQNLRKDNKTGGRGVYLQKNGKFRVYIQIRTPEPKQLLLGEYTYIEHALLARREAEKVLW